jgi:hypothetical protein
VEAMKKRLACIVYFLCIAASGYAQDILENPEEPLAKDSRRTVILDEVMRIRDAGEDFYFKYPRNLKVAPNGFIFIQDQEQFIQFDPNGKFVRNLFKVGQGPGEMQAAGNYFFDGDNIKVHELRNHKILCFDFDGNLLEDFRIQEEARVSRFLLFHKGAYLFLSSERPAAKKTSVVEIYQKLVQIAQKGKKIREMTELQTKGYVAVGKQGGRVFYDISSVIAMPYREHFLFVSHTQEYLLKFYDAEKKRVIRTFKRDYPRVKTPPDAERTAGAMLDGKPVSPPPQKFLNDIQNLLVFKDRLWVVTSTEVQGKGTLIDVFDSEGRYVDCFYLRFPENLVRRYHGDTALDIWEDFLLTIEQDERGNYFLGKYKITEKK